MKPLRLNNQQNRFQAFRDENGVPHLSASTWPDALYGLGFLHSLDRGTQLLFSRTIAWGRGAEEIADSPELLETDRFFRRIGLFRNLDREVELLPDSLREQLRAYCQGVNDGINFSGRSLPMWATGYQPQPWDEASILLVGQLLSFGGLAVSQLQNERLLVDLIHAGVNDQGLRELFAPRLDNVDFDLLRQVQIANQLSDEALELLTDLPRLAGSNAWAVAPSRSDSGSALLAGDPHLEINRLPAIWYEAVLRWGENGQQYVMGATLPGCPLFAVARTEKLAWAVTYLKGDTIDHFIEDCRPGGATGWQYRRGDRWHDFELVEEVIRRKGGPLQTIRIYSNEQGILDVDPSEAGAVDRRPGELKPSQDEIADAGAGYHLSIAWTGNHPHSGSAIGAWLDVVASPTTLNAMDAVRGCVQPTLCWVFADHEGHIGMQTCGRFPKRGGGYNGLTPIPAWDPQNHWNGWLPAEDLPRLYDPPEGFVATANEEINSPNLPPLVTQLVSNYRKRRIDQRLRQMPQATVEQMQELQYDLVSVQARDLLRIFLPHMPPGPAKERLENWDLRFAPDSAEATLFTRLYRNVLIEIFGHEEGIGWRRMVYLITRAGYSIMILVGADRLLQREASYWWRSGELSQIVHRAAENLAKTPGGQTDVPWSKVNNFHFTDRFFGAHHVGRILGFNSRRYPMPGNYSTPFQGHVLQTATRESTFAPSYHFVTDLGTDQAWTNLPGGPSESRFSRYYKIDVSRWFTGQYKKLDAKAEIKA